MYLHTPIIRGQKTNLAQRVIADTVQKNGEPEPGVCFHVNLTECGWSVRIYDPAGLSVEINLKSF